MSSPFGILGGLTVGLGLSIMLWAQIPGARRKWVWALAGYLLGPMATVAIWLGVFR